MSDERWDQIHGPAPPTPLGRFPAVPKLSVPRVLNPQCPEHCSGKHTVDGFLMCPHCLVPAYQVIAHEWFHQEGHNWFKLEPMNGSRPLTSPETPLCNCGRRMQRRWR